MRFSPIHVVHTAARIQTSKKVSIKASWKTSIKVRMEASKKAIRKAVKKNCIKASRKASRIVSTAFLLEAEGDKALTDPGNKVSPCLADP